MFDLCEDVIISLTKDDHNTIAVGSLLRVNVKLVSPSTTEIKNVDLFRAVISNLLSKPNTLLLLFFVTATASVVNQRANKIS